MICWGSQDRGVRKTSEAWKRALRYVWGVNPGERRRFSKKHFRVWKKHKSYAIRLYDKLQQRYERNS